jgi:tryptophan halogenase
VLPEGNDVRADLPALQPLLDAMQSLRHDIRAKAERMLDHRQYIERYCPMADAA